MANIKWSAFTLVGPLATGDTLVGLRAGNNVRFNTLTIPWSPSLGGTGVANTGTITVGGNTAFSGAFTFTGTLTGNTAVTFPTSGTLATTASASGIVNSGLINQLTWYASTGTTVSGLATANNGLLVTSAAGVPSIGNAILANISINSIQAGRGTSNVATNTVFGTASGNALTATSNSNAFFGYIAGTVVTDGIGNALFGSVSGGHLTTGSFNTYLGRSAGESDGALNINTTTAESCTFVGFSCGSGSADAIGCISLGRQANSNKATGTTSGTIGPGIAIGSTAFPVGFRGDGTVYPGSMWRPKINGAFYMVPLLADGATATGTGNLVLATSPTLVTPVLGVATSTSVAASTNITTGVAGTNSGLTVAATASVAAYSYNITKHITGTVATTFLFLTIPAAAMFVGVECLIINSRSTSSGVGTSFLEKRYFTISRNGSGTNVVLDTATALDLNFTSTTAGGGFNATSGETTIIRNGAEPNTAAQVVVLQLNPVTTAGSTGFAIIYCTVLALGSVISIS